MADTQNTYPVNMPVCASTGPVLGRCCQHRTSTVPVLAHYGMFMGYVIAWIKEISWRQAGHTYFFEVMLTCDNINQKSNLRSIDVKMFSFDKLDYQTKRVFGLIIKIIKC